MILTSWPLRHGTRLLARRGGDRIPDGRAEWDVVETVRRDLNRVIHPGRRPSRSADGERDARDRVPANAFGRKFYGWRSKRSTPVRSVDHGSVDRHSSGDALFRGGPHRHLSYLRILEMA